MIGRRGVGEAGLLESMREATLWIDMTSVAPDIAGELAAAATRSAVRYVDAAIGGGPAEARQGALRLYVGGDVDDVVCAQALLRCLSEAGELLHVGGRGAGYLTKLLINQLWFGQAVAFAEALALASATGLGATSFAAAVSGSSADSAFAHGYLPRLLAQDQLPSFELDRIVEQLDGLARTEASIDAPWSVSTVVTQQYRETFDQLGTINGELLTALRIMQKGVDRTTTARSRAEDLSGGVDCRPVADE